MNNLYLIGGSPRCGKTIIFNDLIKNRPMVAIPTDAIRAGVRYINEKGKINCSKDEIEDELPWEMVVGLIHRYDHKNIPLVIEGVVITPERVKSLDLKNLHLRVIFVGFTEDSYIEKILEYAKSEKDWIYDNIERNNGNDSEVRKMLGSIKEKNIKMMERAKEYGYASFSPDDSFEQYRDAAVQYLLG